MDGKKRKGLKGESQADHFVISLTFIMLPRAGKESVRETICFFMHSDTIGYRFIVSKSLRSVNNNKHPLWCSGQHAPFIRLHLGPVPLSSEYGMDHGEPRVQTLEGGSKSFSLFLPFDISQCYASAAPSVRWLTVRDQVASYCYL